MTKPELSQSPEVTTGTVVVMATSLLMILIEYEFMLAIEKASRRLHSLSRHEISHIHSNP